MRTLKARGGWGAGAIFFPIQAKLRGGSGGVVPLLLLFRGTHSGQGYSGFILSEAKKILSTGRLGGKCESMATAPLRESRRRKV